MSSSLKASFRTRRGVLLAAAAAALVGASSGQASVIYWGGGTGTPAASVDTNAATGGAMSGTWDTTTTNWNLDSTLTTGYQAWADGNTPYFKSTATTGGATSNVSLANDVNVVGLTTLTSGTGNAWNLASTDATVRNVNLGAGSVIAHQAGAAANTLTIGSTVNLAGANGFTYSGQNTAGAASGTATMTIRSASTVSGDIAIKSGTMILGTSSAAGGSLLNASKITVNGVNSTLTGFSNTTAGVNVFNDSGEVVLSGGGQLRMQSVSTSVGYNETIGKLTLQGAGLVWNDPRASFNSSVASTLDLANGIDRGANGKGILVTYGGTAFAGLGVTSGSGIVITGHGLGNNAFVPWGLNQGRGYNVGTATNIGTQATTRFMATDGTGRLGVVNSTAANTDLTTWSGAYNASMDIHAEGPNTYTNTLTGNVAVRSIAFGSNTSSSNVGTIALGGNQLATNAIGFATPANGVNLTIGSAANDGTITTTTGSGDLYLIHHRSSTSATSSINVNSKITGGINLVVGGSTADIRLSGANDFTGKTYVAGGTVTLNGSLSGTSEINIAPNATLKLGGGAKTFGGGAITQIISGSGKIDDSNLALNIGANGILSPGDENGNGTLSIAPGTTQKLTLQANSVVRIDLGATSDSIAMLGTAYNNLAGAGTWTLELTTGPGYLGNVPYTIFSNTTTAGLAPGAVVLNGTALSPTDYTWSDDGTTYSISVVPEPGAIGVAVAAIGLTALRRQRRTA